jgi:hypothetical protein
VIPPGRRHDAIRRNNPFANAKPEREFGPFRTLSPDNNVDMSPHLAGHPVALVVRMRRNDLVTASHETEENGPAIAVTNCLSQAQPRVSSSAQTPYRMLSKIVAD